MPTTHEDQVASQLVKIEDLLTRITILRRQAKYRQLLVEGTGLDGRITTMRLIRAVDDLLRSGVQPSVREVAERLVMEHSNTSRAVDQAVEQGLMAKGPSAGDARRVELELTAKGQQSIRDLNARRSAIHRDLGRGWTVSDTEHLTRLLTKLCAAYEDIES